MKKNILTASVAVLLFAALAIIGCGNTQKVKSDKSEVAQTDNTDVAKDKSDKAKDPEMKQTAISGANDTAPDNSMLQEEAKQTFNVKDNGLYAEIQTTKGNILVELFYEQVPMTVMNFVGLAEGTLENNFRKPGEPFYDGLRFHRVMQDFMIQGGDPKGNGSGGPGYKFPDEVHPDITHDGPGILSMANSGPHTNGSQFFITHKATPWLNNIHTVFGKVQEGMDVVNAIKQGDKIEHIIIIREGRSAKKFEVSQEAFNQMQKEAKPAIKERYKAYTKDVAEKVCKGKEVKEAGNGLYYCITEEGKGAQPQRGQKIVAGYHGKFPNGTTFDKGDFPFVLGTGNAIEGWHVGFAELKEGDKATLVVPYWMAYGEGSQFGGQMPGRSTLIFDVELKEIKGQ